MLFKMALAFLNRNHICPKQGNCIFHRFIEDTTKGRLGCYCEKLTVDKLAELIKMSNDNFYKFFKSFTGMSPIEYTNYLRVQKFMLLLVKGYKTSITDIALQTDFYDASCFTKTFKTFKGCTPKEFRKNICKDIDEVMSVNFIWNDYYGLSEQ